MEIYGAKINGLNDSVGFEYDPLLCFWKIRESRGTIIPMVAWWNSCTVMPQALFLQNPAFAR